MKENKWIYNIEFEGMNGIILESRGGAKNAKNFRNPDYKLLRRYILSLIQESENSSVELYVAARNSVYQKLIDRQIRIDSITKFDLSTIDIDEFERKLNEAVKLKGQVAGSKGGNDTKKLFFKTDYIIQTVEQKTILPKEGKPIYSEVIKFESILEEFTFDFNRPRNNQSELKKTVNSLHEELLQHLASKLPNYTWEKEYIPSQIRKDSIDIFGYSKSENKNIVIELDPHRADSIAKKFVSRIALFKDKNVFYVAFLYPGTDKMPKNEAIKYCEDCTEIANVMSNENATKEFLCHFLVK